MSCEHCQRPKVPGERFCRRHRSALLREMRRSGYFTQVPRTAWSSREYQAGFLPDTEIRVLAKY